MEPLTASFLLCSLKSIFCLHPWSSKKVSLTVTIHFKDSLLLLMPPVNRTPALATGAWRRSGRESTILFSATAEGQLAYWFVCTEGYQYFCPPFASNRETCPVFLSQITIAEVKHKRVKPGRKNLFSRLTLAKTILWLTAQKGNTQRFVPEQNVPLFYAIEDLIWFQSHWLDLCYWSPNAEAVSQKMAGFSYYLGLEIVE